MPDSNGVASRLPASVAVAGELITADKHNLTQDDNIQMLNNRVQKDGSTPFTASQTGVAGTTANHLATKGQVEALVDPLNTFQTGQKWLPLTGFPQTITNVPRILLTGLSTRNIIRVNIRYARPVVDNQQFFMRVSADGTTFLQGSIDYRICFMGFPGGTFATGNVLGSAYYLTAPELDVNDTVNNSTVRRPLSAEIMIYNNLGGRLTFSSRSVYGANSSGTEVFNCFNSFGGIIASLQSIEFKFQNGNIAAGDVHAEYLAS